MFHWELIELSANENFVHNVNLQQWPQYGRNDAGIIVPLFVAVLPSCSWPNPACHTEHDKGLPPQEVSPRQSLLRQCVMLDKSLLDRDWNVTCLSFC